MVLAPGAVGLKFWRPADQIISGADAVATALLHFDGANGSTSIVDSSGNGFVFTTAGSAVLDTSQAMFGTASFNPNGGRLNGAGAAGLNFGTGDFTVDFWFYENGTPTDDVTLVRFGGGPGSSFRTSVYLTNSSTIKVIDNVTTVITGTIPTLNVWHHVALTRSGGVTRLFMDGVQQGSVWTDAKNYSNSATEPLFLLGGAGGLIGWLDEVRIVVGTAVWTSNFSPPSLPYPNPPAKLLAAAGAYALTGTAATLTYVPIIPNATALLHFDGTNGSTTIVDSSGNNYTFAVAGAAALDTSTAVFGPSSLHCTGGSVQGTGATGLNFGTGDYTVDFRFTNAVAAYAGPGDVLPSALAWWGLRGYNAAYAGPCIDICDGNGSFLTTINIVANRIDASAVNTWAAAHGGLGNVSVDKWYDQTGNGFHMVLGNQRAMLVQNTLGAYPSVQFLQSHGDYYKVTTGITRAQPFFVSWVGRRTANFTTTQAVFASAGVNNTSTGFGNVANTIAIAAYTGGSAAVSNANTTDNVFHAIQGNFNGDPSSDIMADGTRYTGLSPSTEGLSGQMGLGTGTNPTSAALTGDICEVGVWAGLQSSGTETAMNSNQHGADGYNF